jgi:phytoene synthase
MSPFEAEAAFRSCEEITRRAAGNFYYGIRLLPPDKRRAMCAVYAFARRVDDVGDGSLPADEKERRLELARADLASLTHDSPDPVLAALGHARERFPLPMSAFGELIDGVTMDVHGRRYDRAEELEVYCRRVAGSIGRLSVAVFGTSDAPAASARADDLGIGMQLTNILRDVREDGSRGRVYLPREDRERFGCAGDLAAAPPRNLEALVRFEAHRARAWFVTGLELLPMLDSRSRACVGAMSDIYRRILDRIERRPGDVLRGRIALPASEKAWVAARNLVPL